MGALHLIAVRGGLRTLFLVALSVLRLLTAQWCLWLVAQVYTAPTQVVQSTAFGWNGVYIQFDSAISGVVGLKRFDRGDIRLSTLVHVDEVIE